MGESVLSDPYCLKDSGVSQLLHDFLLVEESWTLGVVWFYASDELRRSGHHLLQQVHQRISEVGCHGLLSS